MEGFFGFCFGFVCFSGGEGDIFFRGEGTVDDYCWFACLKMQIQGVHLMVLDGDRKVMGLEGDKMGTINRRLIVVVTK